MVEFNIEIKYVAKTVYFHKKILCSSSKRNYDIFREKNCGFVASEFVKIKKYVTSKLNVFADLSI